MGQSLGPGVHNMAQRVAARLAAAASEGRYTEELQAMMATETDPAALMVLRHMQTDAAQKGPLHQSLRSVKDEFPGDVACVWCCF